MNFEKREKLLFSIPGILYFLIIIVVPIITTVAYSFQRFIYTKPTEDIKWIGFENYIKIFSDPYFWSSLKNTFIFLIAGVFLELILGLILALAINEVSRRNNIINSIILLPSITAPIVIGLIFRFIYSNEFGIGSFLLEKIGLFKEISLLGNSSTSLAAIISADVWQWTPFIAIILLSGLIGLPIEPFEAAKIDGANYFGILTKITLPLLKPVIRIALLLRIVDIIKEFDKIYVMTNGGPGNSSEILNFTAFRVNYVTFNMGLGSAYVIIILILIIILSIAIVKFITTEQLL